jgi:2-polyprenyl-3-methyl-5-hydroxy-6-metoxy-1,4-benzoquinol methylase
LSTISSLSDEEKVSFISNYAKACERSKNSRFHYIMETFDALPKGRALDYGCGWGHNTVSLSKRGFCVVGIDHSLEEVSVCNLAWASFLGPNLCFEHKTIIDFADASFNYVLSNQVIEHVHNPGLYLSEINRVLLPEGKLVISLPNIMTIRYFVNMLYRGFAQSLFKRSVEVNEHYDKSSDHIQAWDPYHFTTLVSTVGFKLEKYIPMEGLPVPINTPLTKEKGYWQTKIKRLSNLSYTMLFQFKKIADVRISPQD